MTDHNFWLTEGQFARLEPLLPTDTRGVERVDDRRVISGIVHVLKSGSRWKDAPPCYGPHKTLYNRFVRWAAKGVWEEVFVRLAESGGPPAVAPANFDIALVDIGFPIEDISGRYSLDIDGRALELESVEMSALGGTVRAAPFRFELDADSKEVLLAVERVQLPLMVGLANLDDVDISGSVSGDIPIRIRGGSVIVEDGSLEADAPGGSIRYRGGATAGIVDEESQLGIVTRTLQNFQYEKLTSEVHYTEQGDLKLQMRLTGTNPDVDPDQPVILNLGIENNVPQMLRSLQATRSIEEVLEKRLSK